MSDAIVTLLALILADSLSNVDFIPIFAIVPSDSRDYPNDETWRPFWSKKSYSTPLTILYIEYYRDQLQNISTYLTYLRKRLEMCVSREKLAIKIHVRGFGWINKPSSTYLLSDMGSAVCFWEYQYHKNKIVHLKTHHLFETQ